MHGWNVHELLVDGNCCRLGDVWIVSRPKEADPRASGRLGRLRESLLAGRKPATLTGTHAVTRAAAYVTDQAVVAG